MLALDLAIGKHVLFPGISIRRTSAHWARPVKEEIQRAHQSSQLALGAALWVNRGVLWFDFSSEIVFWNCWPSVLIHHLSFPCLCFLVGISKGSFEASEVTPPSLPTVPRKKEDSPEKAPDPTVPTLNHPLEESCFPHGLSEDLRDIYLIISLQWPFWEFPLCVSTFLPWFCKLSRNHGIDSLLL